MSVNRIAEDPEQLGIIATLHSEEEDDDEGAETELPHYQWYCLHRRNYKRIRSCVGIGVNPWFAITIAFIICTTLVTPRPVPRQTGALSATKTMKVLNGREIEEQMETCSASPSTREERRLTGPGSHPPSCKSKCGRCVPCKSVRVPIHPGRNRPLEYYPEAWRCKCGNKLYIP